MTNKIGVRPEWLYKLQKLAAQIEDPAARELLTEIVDDLYEIGTGDCE